MHTPAEVVYTLDDRDRIVDVNEAWSEFALANDGGALLPGAVLGRPVWDFIADAQTSLLYARLFERVRAGDKVVRFAFRCDAPATRRLLEMSITRQPGDSIRIVVRLLQQQERQRVPILDAQAPRSAAYIRMCAWCKRIPNARGEWLEIEDAIVQLGLFDQAPVPDITHGMCEACSDAMMASLDDSNAAPMGPIVLGAMPTAA